MSAKGSSDAEAAGPGAAARGATIIAPPVVSSPFNVSRRFINVPHKNTAHPFPGHAASGRKVRRYRSQLEAHPRHDHAAEMVVLVIAVREILDPAIAVIVGQVGAIERPFDMLVAL